MEGMVEHANYHYSGVTSIDGITARMWNLIPETYDLRGQMDFGCKERLRVNFYPPNERKPEYAFEVHSNPDGSNYLKVWRRQQQANNKQGDVK